jgi:hypothetical protein
MGRKSAPYKKPNIPRRGRAVRPVSRNNRRSQIAATEGAYRKTTPALRATPPRRGISGQRNPRPPAGTALLPKEPLKGACPSRARLPRRATVTGDSLRREPLRGAGRSPVRKTPGGRRASKRTAAGFLSTSQGRLSIARGARQENGGRLADQQ